MPRSSLMLASRMAVIRSIEEAWTSAGEMGVTIGIVRCFVAGSLDSHISCRSRLSGEKKLSFRELEY